MFKPFSDAGKLKGFDASRGKAELYALNQKRLKTGVFKDDDKPKAKSRLKK